MKSSKSWVDSGIDKGPGAGVGWRMMAVGPDEKPCAGLEGGGLYKRA